MATAKDSVLYTPRGRMIYPHLIKPQEETRDGVLKKIYSFQLNVPKDGGDKFPKALREMEEYLSEMCREKFGSRWADDVDLPFKDGDTHKNKRKYDFNKGMICIDLRSYEIQPGLGVLNSDGEVVECEKHKQADEFYAGSWVVASYNSYCFQTDKNKGISVGLRTVVKIEDDVKIISKATVDGDFKGKDLSAYAKPKAMSEDEADGV